MQAGFGGRTSGALAQLRLSLVQRFGAPWWVPNLRAAIYPKDVPGALSTPEVVENWYLPPQAYSALLFAVYGVPLRNATTDLGSLPAQYGAAAVVPAKTRGRRLPVQGNPYLLPGLWTGC